MATSLDILANLVTIRGASSKYNYCKSVGNCLSDSTSSEALPPEEVASWDISGNNCFYGSFPKPFCLSAPSGVRSPKLSAYNGIFSEGKGNLFLNGNGLFTLTSDFSQNYTYSDFALKYVYPQTIYLEDGFLSYNALKSLLSAVYSKASNGQIMMYSSNLEDALPWKTDAFPKIKLKTFSSSSEERTAWIECSKYDISGNNHETINVFLDDVPGGVDFTVEKSANPNVFVYVSSSDMDYTHFDVDLQFSIEMDNLKLENASQLKTISQLEQVETIWPGLFSTLTIEMKCQNLRKEEWDEMVSYDSLSGCFRLVSSRSGSSGEQIVLSAESPYVGMNSIILNTDMQVADRTIYLESYYIQAAKPLAHNWTNSFGEDVKYESAPNNFSFITTPSFIVWKESGSGEAVTKFDVDKLIDNDKFNVLSSAVKTTSEQILTNVKISDYNNSLLNETTNILFR